MNNPTNTFLVPYDDNGAWSPYYPPNERGEPPSPLAPRRHSSGHTSVFDEHIDKLQAEVTELRAQLANKHAEFEALWNETNGTARDRRSKALIRLSGRLIELNEIEIKKKIQEKEQDIRALEALIARN